jgi:site-specific recombinase XerD
LDAVKQFAAWLVQDRRVGDNPLAHLAGGNVKVDRRHDRQPLSAAELRLIVQAARGSGKSFGGLTGSDRAMLYSVACASGFRASELASLSPKAFDLDAVPPAVILVAENAKNGRTAVQPLPPELAQALRAYLAVKPSDQPVWSGTWCKKAADMLRIDLDASGISYVSDGPDGQRYRDFHSLRHSFIAMLDKSGATLKEAMQLARHSDPKLTMAVYGRAQLHDLGNAVSRLPDLSSEPEPVAMKATGTDSRFVRRFAQPNARECGDMVGDDGDGPRTVENAANPNPLPTLGFEADKERMIPNEPSSPSETLYEHFSKMSRARSTLVVIDYQLASFGCN